MRPRTVGRASSVTVAVISSVEVSSETLTEWTPDVLGKISYLTYVLSYDDLLASSSAIVSLQDVARPFVLGRAAHAGPPAFETGTFLGVPDQFVSQRHARIERRGDDDWLCDLGSRNGTFVNGQRVGEHRVADGDVIEVGHSLLCYRVVDAATATRLGGPEAELRLGPTRTFNAEIAAVIAELHRMAPSRESILILGETGVGKEIAAG
jgi:hypothetical protein